MRAEPAWSCTPARRGRARLVDDAVVDMVAFLAASRMRRGEDGEALRDVLLRRTESPRELTHAGSAVADKVEQVDVHRLGDRAKWRAISSARPSANGCGSAIQRTPSAIVCIVVADRQDFWSRRRVVEWLFWKSVRHPGPSVGRRSARSAASAGGRLITCGSSRSPGAAFAVARRSSRRASRMALSGAGWQANGSDSVSARTLIEQNFAGLSSSAPMVVLHSPTLTAEVAGLRRGDRQGGGDPRLRQPDPVGAGRDAARASPPTATPRSSSPAREATRRPWSPRPTT